MHELDADSSAILLMLDLSAAFDTIDHNILLSRLCNVNGITGNVLDWFGLIEEMILTSCDVLPQLRLSSLFILLLSQKSTMSGS